LTIKSAAGFSAIHHQEKAVHRLTGWLQGGNLPHALLFTGIDGIGKKKTALTFAGALNCRMAADRRTAVNSRIVPCGECRPCRKIEAGQHPDVIVITPEKSRIKILTIRNLGHTLAVKPYEASQRVVVIDQAQTMNPEAGNSLLKLLEEPPENTVLILIADNKHNLLPTIVSRCQQVAFKPIPGHAIAEYLEKQGVRGDKAAILAKLANGSYGKADSLVDAGWVGRREWIIQLVDPHDGGGDRSVQIRSFLAFSELMSLNREAIPDALEILISWFRDLAVVKAGSNRVANTDLMEKIARAARHYETASLLADIDLLEAAKKNIQANVNTRLTLDVMMMNLSPIRSAVR